MPGIDGKKSAPKLSYADGIEAWQWYVGSGIYIDEIETIIKDREKNLKQDIFNHIAKIGGLMVISLLLVHLITRRLAR